MGWSWKSPTVVRAIAAAAAGIAIWHLVTVAWTVGARIRFNADIDWLEGGEIYHAFRWSRGEGIYQPPTEGFLPYPYPPLYWVILAGVGSIFGIDYASARTLSAVAFAVIIVLLGLELRSRIGAGRAGWFAALLGAATVAMTYPDVGGFYDLARVDTLAQAFVVISTFAVVRRRIVWAALAATCAVYTKQTMLFPVVALAASMLLQRDTKVLVRFLLVAGGSSLAALAVLEWSTHGLFLMWMLDTRHHGVDVHRLWTAGHDLLLAAPWLLVPLLALHRSRVSAQTKIWVAVLGGCTVAAVLPFIKIGGFPNNLIPVAALAGPVALMVLIDWTARAHPAARQAVLAAAGIVLALKIYDAEHYRPTAKSRKAADDLSAQLRRLSGPILCPLHPFAIIRSGHLEEQMGWINQIDAVTGKTGATYEQYMSNILVRRPEYVLLDGNSIEAPILDNIGGDYLLIGDVEGPPISSIVGMNTIPKKLYRHRR